MTKNAAAVWNRSAMQPESKGPMAMHTIAEQAPQHQSAGSQATSGDGLLRPPHTNRPSRLSAVLVPAAPASASISAHSPPPSPPSASGSSRTAALPKVPSCDGLNQLDKQELGHLSPTRVSPKGAAVPAGKASTAQSPTSAQQPSSVKAAQASSKPVAAAAGAAPAASDAARTASRNLGAAASNPLSPMASSSDSSSADGENDDGLEWVWDSPIPWYNKPRVVAVIVLLLASVGLALAGVVLQLFQDPTGVTHDFEELFPWLYFFAAFPPLALALRWLCWRLYAAAEYTAIREELYFLRPLKAKLAGVLFWLAVLLWFQACFHWLWCQEVCGEEAYQKTLHIFWRLLICVTLFAIANFLKCSIARVLSYSFYRTAHFAKVRDAIERELYLIRLSQARSTLLPPPPPPEPDVADEDQHSNMQLKGPVGWGSTVWRKTSQVFLGQHAFRHAQQEAPGEGFSTDQAQIPSTGPLQYGSPAPMGSAFAGPVAQQQPLQGVRAETGMRHVSSADTIAEDAAVHVQVRQMSDTTLKRLPVAAPHAADYLPLLHHQPGSCPTATPKVSWQQADLAKAQQHPQQQPYTQQHPAGDQAHRQQSYEIFTVERVPSILGQQHQRSGSRSGSKAGSQPGSRVGQGLLRGGRTGSKFSTGSTAKRVSLPGMVAGVDGLLLQPDVLGNAGTADGEGPGRPGQPMSEEQLSQLRSRLGVNTFGTFVDRYYGMTPKEEEAHVRQVKRFAKGLFANVLGDANRDHILPEDFVLFFDGDKEQAHDAFSYFDRNKDGSISCAELQESAAEMLCERKNIAASIKDTDSVVNSLETGLGMLIHFVFIALYLLVWGVNIVQGFTTFSATALALTFVFGDSVKGVFESALFLFVEHPYDVGDALWMPPGMLYRVKKIDLQYTVLLKSDGQLVWTPNNTLRTQPLVNLSRSNPRWEAYTWLVDLDTPDEVLVELEGALAAHVAKQRPHFSCSPSVTWRALEDPLKLRLAVGVTYSFTGEDAGRYVTARHGILGVVRRELSRLGVKYTVPLQQPNYVPLQQQATPLQ